MEYTKENIIKLIQAMQAERYEWAAEAEKSSQRTDALIYSGNTLGAVLLILEDERYFKDYCTMYRDKLETFA